MPNDVLSVSVACSASAPLGQSRAWHSNRRRQETLPTIARGPERKRAATLCQEGRYSFDPAALKVVPEWPLIYWWGVQSLQRYRTLPAGESSAFKIFPELSTGDNERFLRRWFEVNSTPIDPCTAEARDSYLVRVT